MEVERTKKKSKTEGLPKSQGRHAAGAYASSAFDSGSSYKKKTCGIIYLQTHPVGWKKKRKKILVLFVYVLCRQTKKRAYEPSAAVQVI